MLVVACISGCFFYGFAVGGLVGVWVGAIVAPNQNETRVEACLVWR